MQIIDTVIFEHWAEPDPHWEGPASDLRSKLLDNASDRTMLQKEIADLLKSEVQTGQYLARLMDHPPERVQELPRKGDKRGWRILAPKVETEPEAAT